MLPCERELAGRDGRLGGQLVDVGTGDERLFARAGDDDCADCVVGLEIERDAPQLVERVAIEGVENLRPVDGDDGDGAVAVQQKVVKDHRGTIIVRLLGAPPRANRACRRSGQRCL